jgi:hypothetical protein
MECESIFELVGGSVSLINPCQAIALPLLYRDVPVYLEGDKKNIQPLVSTLAALEAADRSMWPFIRALSIYEGSPVPEAYKIPEDDVAVLQDLLSQSRGLETVRIYNASAIITHVCERACKMSLLHLVVHCDLGVQFSRLLPIGLLAGLRTLHIAVYSLSQDVLPSRANAWTLPNLHELRWEEEIYYIPSEDVETIKFLALCQFPRLRRVELCVEVDIDDGPLLFSNFLHTHAEIEDLDLVTGMNTDEDPLAVSISKTKMTRFSLQRCGSVTPLLVHWLPPSLKRLDLPVFLEPVLEEETDICAVLHMLQNHAKGNLRDVHLAFGYPWGKEERVSPRPFRFDSSTPEATGISTSQHQAIQHVSAKLGALGINVYDEDGMTVADYE